MKELIFIDGFLLIPLSLIGLAAAIILLRKRRKKDGVRPANEKKYLAVSIVLIVFVFAALIVIPSLYFLSLIFDFGPLFIFSWFKSI